MQGAGFLTTNANTAWPFDENDTRLDLAFASMFADGSAVLAANETVSHVVVRDAVSSAGMLVFEVDKIGPDGAVRGSARISAEPDFSKPYYVVRGPWCSFVLDTFCVRKNDGMRFGGPYRMAPTATVSMADRVTSISVYNSHDGGAPTLDYAGIEGNVKLVAGTNAYVGDDLDFAAYGAMMVGTGDDDSDTFDGVVFSAIAGEGAGKVPCGKDCGDKSYSGGNVIPDETGSVVIEGDDCYQVSPDGYVRITGRCTACCQCDDFVSLGDRLSEYSRTASEIYSRALSMGSTFNANAEMFNRSLSVVSKEELVARGMVMAQGVNAGGARSVDMARGPNNIRGSIDRAQGVIYLKNMSKSDVTASVKAKMSPQSIVLASLVRPRSSASDYTSVNNTTVRCNGSYNEPSIGLPSGSGATIRLYAATSGSASPSSGSRLEATVLFRWTETDVETGEVAVRTLERRIESIANIGRSA